MLLVLLYLIGKPFYNLATQNDKNKWLFGQLGIFVFFVGGTFLANIIILLIMIANIARPPDDGAVIVYSSLIGGVFCYWAFKRFLMNRWNNNLNNDDTILDDI